MSQSAAYFRDYRARRKAAGDPVPSRARSRGRHPGIAFSDVLMTLVADEVANIGMRKFARAILVDHSTVSRWLSGARVTMYPVDALVDYFGWERVRVRRADMRALMATTGDSVDPADTGLRSSWLPREINRESRRHPWKASIHG